ncbi:hypothetical protein LV779_06950 [Streptomyces thinghirensis]|nr:hypothetical protein [Streptomyces thinghirensis]
MGFLDRLRGRRHGARDGAGGSVGGDIAGGADTPPAGSRRRARYGREYGEYVTYAHARPRPRPRGRRRLDGPAADPAGDGGTRVRESRTPGSGGRLPTWQNPSFTGAPSPAVLNPGGGQRHAVGRVRRVGAAGRGAGTSRAGAAVGAVGRRGSGAADAGRTAAGDTGGDGAVRARADRFALDGSRDRVRGTGRAGPAGARHRTGVVRGTGERTGPGRPRGPRVTGAVRRAPPPAVPDQGPVRAGGRAAPGPAREPPDHERPAGLLGSGTFVAGR